MSVSRLLAGAAALAAVGCASPWLPCPDRLVVSGALERGTVNGSDLAKLLQGGEADGVDSNYEGYSVGGALEFSLGTPVGACPALSRRPLDQEAP